ncbi:hypothetical protein ID866_10366 [Astraeus odoratus]|nr:hypothetical protein ID866_10366 [Astraeus odoratus]
MCYQKHTSKIAHQNKTTLQSSLSKQLSSGGSSKSSISSSSNQGSSFSFSGKSKNPQHHSSTSTASSFDSSAPDFCGILSKDSKLTTVEHLHHITNALCLFCGLPGHSAKDYPKHASCTAKAHTAQADSIAAKFAEKFAEAKK